MKSAIEQVEHCLSNNFCWATSTSNLSVSSPNKKHTRPGMPNIPESLSRTSNLINSCELFLFARLFTTASYFSWLNFGLLSLTSWILITMGSELLLGGRNLVDGEFSLAINFSQLRKTIKNEVNFKNFFKFNFIRKHLKDVK